MIFEEQIVNLYKSMMHTRCDDTENNSKRYDV